MLDLLVESVATVYRVAHQHSCVDRLFAALLELWTHTSTAYLLLTISLIANSCLCTLDWRCLSAVGGRQIAEEYSEDTSGKTTRKSELCDVRRCWFWLGPTKNANQEEKQEQWLFLE